MRYLVGSKLIMFFAESFSGLFVANYNGFLDRDDDKVDMHDLFLGGLCASWSSKF